MSNEDYDKVKYYLFSQGAVGREAGPPDCIHLHNLTVGTQGTEYTNDNDWKLLHAKGTEKPKKTIPGLQIEGYFLDKSSRTTLTPGNRYGKRSKNGNKVYPYDSQFVIRFPDPDYWEGRLVITGSPGIRGQYANDIIIGDHVLQKGCAFASTDKGNSGLRFYSADQGPGDAVAEWHRRINQLARVVKEAAKEYYGYYRKELKYTYITGIGLS